MSESNNLLESLYAKFSDSRQPEESKDLKSSKIYSLLEDPFGLWCWLHAPKEDAVYEPNQYDNARSLRATELKEDWVAKRFPDAVKIDSRAEENEFRQTLAAMIKGAPAILFPALWDLKDNMYGRGNIIVRQDTAPSVFGNYHYEIVQYKQALEVKDHYALQGALLNRILGIIQGYEPPFVKVLLKDKDAEVPQTAWNSRLDNEIAKWNDIASGKLVPEPCRPPHAANPPWRAYANRRVYETRHLVLLPGIGWDTRLKLKQAGLTDIDKVFEAGLPKITELVEDPPAKEIFFHAKAYHERRPIIKDNPIFPPIRKPRNLYFDFENFDLEGMGHRPHTYLIGIWDAEKASYAALLAKGDSEEEKVFRDFIDYVGDPSQAVLYHWTEHEVHYIKDAAKRYPSLKPGLDALCGSCVDLKRLVQKSFYMPAPSLSLKAVAPAMGFTWRQHDCGAMDSMVFYMDWVKNGNETAITKVLTYNEDDCVAMLHVDKQLSSYEYKTIQD